ncbi:hypothetical protein BDV95DRAFT_603048 [Massariosphaeria phaeospora]|uniref:DUF7918 domain-containing protein n=1 Tax=Massariosphaeria phaeospora TaxID=100035 RepID=A0A7C8IBP1_9PLEO|nr:hypothetical protein BDV95DRAFT_603048 [Massariosphaeria phaeospora]
MPTYRGINVALHSQFDIETLPEYLPQPQAYYAEQGTTAKAPALIDDGSSTCCVYVPVLPGSQFWIGYSVSPPVPADQQFLFKLFINGAHIVSWSTGKDEGWKGKTMFALYEREEGGKKRMERRVLCFTPSNRKNGEWKDVQDAFDEDARVEIRVHRAHGRRRVARQAEEFARSSHAQNGRGINLINAGRAGAEHPKRFYKFALIDPIDQPFATFRYYYRTWEQIRYLGLLGREAGVSEDVSEIMSVIEPEGADTPDLEKVAKADASRNEEESRVKKPDSNAVDGSEAQTCAPSDDSVIDEGIFDGPSDKQAHLRYSCVRTPPHLYRLSIPPSCKLEPPERSSSLYSRPLPSIPQKSDSTSSTSYRPHPAYPVEDWLEKTPSPVKSVRDNISTPPLKKCRALSATSLLSAVAQVWKRRGTPSGEFASEAGSRNTVRSVS